MLNLEQLETMKIQPVGDGMTDLICSVENVEAFIALCNATKTDIKGFTWWCHVTEGHEPCGMGGPKSKYFDGWFSEIRMRNIVSLIDNDSYREYLKNSWPLDDNYHECWWPGFWIE